MNVLSHTSLSQFTCNESLNITPGKPCFSSKILKKLDKLEKELNVQNIYITPIITDQEALPSDGSDESNMIRSLAALLDCSSQFCILQQDSVKELLTIDELKKEKSRFKVRGPRNTNVGTDGEKHAYRVLLQWSEVFNFFYPLPHIIISKTEPSKYKLSVSDIMEIIDNQYPAVRLIAADMSIKISEEDVCGWHAIVLLIDLRGNNNEKWTVEYFDSTGYPPENFISDIMEELANQLRHFRNKLKHKGLVSTIVVSGRLKHQLTSAECGMHSLIYIRRRLEGISYQAFSKYKIPDNFAKEFRRDIFVD